LNMAAAAADGAATAATCVRPKAWSEQVEDAYRFQLAGYRDAQEYRSVRGSDPERWNGSGFIKKLERRDGSFYYFNKVRECADKEVLQCKLYH
ncbi:hypothetical protein BOX15_Mlig026870g1, partial [Macrostomum lignano]